MKEILKHFVYVFMTFIGCIVELVAIVFAGTGWVFNKCAELLSKVSDICVSPTKDTEEVSTEDVPT